MTGVLAAYLRRHVAIRTLLLTAFFVALMQVLELMDVTTDILDRGLGARGLAYYAWLRAPSEITLALPLAALLGAMWAFHDLARNHEMVAIRTSGVNLKQIMAYLVPVPLAVALAYALLMQAVVPETEATLQAWWRTSAPREESPEPTWLRTSSGPLSYLDASPDGRRLEAVRIYMLDATGLLAARVTARSAEYRDGAWHLAGVETLRVPGAQAPAASAATGRWLANLDPEDVRRAEIVRPKLSSLALIDVIGGERTASQPLSYYQTALYRSLTTPLAPFIMVLLALPAARGLPRRSDGAAALLLVLVLGLGFLLADGFMGALGTSGRVPALVAALTAPLAFAAIGLAQLHFSERR